MQRQPSSPGSSPVELGDCLEELLKFTLQSHIDGALDHDLGLPTDFCSNLLNDNLPPPNLDRPDVSRLYEDLVSTLWKSVSNASCGSLDDLEDKEECNELIAQGGAELVNVLKTVNFELHVQEPFFTQLKDGLKRVEGRCAAGDYNRIQPGALILFNKCLLFEVQDVCQYPSFSAMLKAESLDKVLPGVKTLTDGSSTLKRKNCPMVSLGFMSKNLLLSHTLFCPELYLLILAVGWRVKVQNKLLLVRAKLK